MKYQPLVQTLEAVGKATETWLSPDGSRVLVLPYGGRVLGLFTPQDDENLFWTHAALEQVDTAQSFYQGEQWHNSGGERTWLGPEVDFFFPEYPNLTRYFQQRELDPGAYTVSREGGELAWKTQATLVPSRTKQPVQIEIAKSLAPANNPFRHDHPEKWADLRFAGYTLRTSLRLTGESSPPYIGLWSLTQMPHGGEMLVPTYFQSEPKIYMGDITGDDLQAGQRLIRYTMRAAGEHKIGVRALALTGRAGYLKSSGEEAFLIVRNFLVNPSGEYADVPWLETDDFGYCMQACNVNSYLGEFSELEYHVPAIGTKTGQSVSHDESQLWAFRGPTSVIRAAAQRLLSADA